MRAGSYFCTASLAQRLAQMKEHAAGGGGEEGLPLPAVPAA